MGSYPLNLSMLIHGEHGVGKSTLANTAPGPRLVLDAEGGSRFQRQLITFWDPMVSAPPAVDELRNAQGQVIGTGPWDMCIVYVRDYQVVQQVYQWLAPGGHPFRSLVIDSIPEIQKKLKDQIAGTEQLKMQQWGELLRILEDYIRKLRDLTFHPSNPLDAVVIVGLTHLRDGKFRASVEGKLELNMPSFVDVVGYLYVEQVPGTADLARRLLIAPINGIDAKDRTATLTETYGIVITEPNITTMLDVINSVPLGGTTTA
jgi:hypothetical protein